MASGPLDRPRDRGSHRRPTATAGGLGVVVGSSLGCLTLVLFAGSAWAGAPVIAAAFAGAAALGLLGALDDLYDLGARAKLLAQLLAALLFVLLAARVETLDLGGGAVLRLGAVIGAAGTALWLVVVCNAVNFMDGANGLAPGVAVIGFLAFALACALGGEGGGGLSGGLGLADAALIAGSAGLGFLPWNLAGGRLFQGDAGALFSAFLLAALAVAGAGPNGRGPCPLYFVPMVLTPFLADVLLTLLARARAGKPLFQAHAEHLYQQWLSRRLSGSHLALALRVYAVVGLYAAAALALSRFGPALQFAGLALGVAVSVIGWVQLKRRLA
jgi:Fuc2NAc and GlcNAc transferase